MAQGLPVHRNVARPPHTAGISLYDGAKYGDQQFCNSQFEEKWASSADEILESSADEISVFDDAEQVHHALDKLPLPQREALTLYFLQDLSMEEIATLLAVPVGTVRSRLHYGKALIRKILLQGDDHVR